MNPLDKDWGLKLRDQTPIDPRAAEILNLKLEFCKNSLQELQQKTLEILSKAWKKDRRILAKLFGIKNPHPYDPVELTNPNPPCPACKSLLTNSIVYGYIFDFSGFGPFETAGGCCLAPERYVCTNCHHRW